MLTFNCLEVLGLNNMQTDRYPLEHVNDALPSTSSASPMTSKTLR